MGREIISVFQKKSEEEEEEKSNSNGQQSLTRQTSEDWVGVSVPFHGLGGLAPFSSVGEQRLGNIKLSGHVDEASPASVERVYLSAKGWRTNSEEERRW